MAATLATGAGAGGARGHAARPVAGTGACGAGAAGCGAAACGAGTGACEDTPAAGRATGGGTTGNPPSKESVWVR